MSALLRMPEDERRRFLIDAVPHNHWLGMQVAACTAGHVSLALPPATHVCHVGAGAHEGALVALMDAACGSLPMTVLEDRCRTATLDLRLDFLRPAPAGVTIRCDAELAAMSSDIALVRGVAHGGDARTPIAVGLGSFAIFRRAAQPDPEYLATEAHRRAIGATMLESYAQSMAVSGSSDGGAQRMRLPYGPHLVGNPQTQAVHGGALGALLYLAAQAEIERAGVPRARLFSLSVEYLGTAPGRDAYASATVVSRSRRFANLRASVFQHSAAQPCTVATAQFLLEA